jgi:hypothetical protein
LFLYSKPLSFCDRVRKDSYRARSNVSGAREIPDSPDTKVTD